MAGPPRPPHRKRQPAAKSGGSQLLSEKAEKVTKSQVSRFLAFALPYIAIGVVTFHILEDFGWIDSLYFVVVTLATVGYGDLAPQTQAGRLFAAFYIIFGVVIFVAFAKIVFLRVYERRKARKQSRTKKHQP